MGGAPLLAGGTRPCTAAMVVVDRERSTRPLVSSWDLGGDGELTLPRSNQLVNEQNIFFIKCIG